MEKIFTLLWILFAIGVFVFRMIVKMRDTNVQESQERPRKPGSAVPELPTATFQELLRQMQAKNAGETSTEAQGPMSRSAEAPSQPVGKRTLGGRLLPREIARPARTQERTRVRQTSLEAPAAGRPHTHLGPLVRRSSSLPRASHETPLVRSAQPTDAPRTTALNATVRQMLSQPATVRAAFVLSEIFQRRY
ncbi:hypothetical protein I2I05_19335 [Hymenobacter sp. BT683]|uniref:Uncharacterized protein n=1 Tax=Hymenobacter jeongseonensis TaxID=2791027 RepID=A0ABS0INH0_9BACT|nr:hypothetical protein [Hymenobacter jeongseonensis]MBF9239554.1 hypothetical protein [Hymenobacter jeongseonensis]